MRGGYLGEEERIRDCVGYRETPTSKTRANNERTTESEIICGIAVK